MKTSFFKRTIVFMLAVMLILPTFSSCTRKITLDDAKYTMGKLFSAMGSGDYSSAVKLMYNPTEISTSRFASFLAEVEEKTGGRFSDGITNVRYNDYEELGYNAPGGSKFRVEGTMNIGSRTNVPFIISLIKSTEGYGINVFDIAGVAL